MMEKIYSNPIIGFGLAGVLMIGAFVGTVMVARAYAENPSSTVRSPTEDVTGRPGPQGPRGPQGEPGGVGLRGPKGPPGADGDDGAVGDPGVSGDRGPAGPRGDRGPRGPRGRIGLRGLAGLAGLQCPEGFSARVVNVPQGGSQGTIVLFACVRG